MAVRQRWYGSVCKKDSYITHFPGNLKRILTRVAQIAKLDGGFRSI